MLNSAEIGWMQAQIVESLPDAAVIERQTRVSDAMGGASVSWVSVDQGIPLLLAGGDAVPCRVSPAGFAPDERLIAERLQGDLAWTLTLPAGTDVTEKDRIMVGTRTFEVIGVLAPRSWEVSRRVVCVEKK